MSFPNPGFQQQPQGYGPPPQQQPGYQQPMGQPQGYGQPQQQVQQPAPLTQSVDDWFSNNQGAGGAPSFKFNNDGDTIIGDVVEMAAGQQTDMDTGAPLWFNDGSPRMQLVVTLQTELRGWQGVGTVPTVRDAQGNELAKDPSLDDGKRRIYVKSKMQKALMDALRATGAKKLNEGDKLAVRQIGTEPNPKVKNGQPVRLFQVSHQAGNPGADAFFAGQQQAAAPAQQGPPPQQYGGPQQLAGQPNPVAQQYAPPTPPQQGPPPQQQPQYAPQQQPAQQAAPAQQYPDPPF